MKWQALMDSIPDDCELIIRLGSKATPIPNAITLRLRERSDFGGRVEMFITGEALDGSVIDGVGMIGMVVEDMKSKLAAYSRS